MKTIWALSLLVGLALCNSTAFYGWSPNKEIVFRFESEILTGIPQIQSQYSGLKLASDVKVQTFDDYTLRIGFENPRYISVNQKLVTRNGRPLIPKPDQQLPENLRKHLVTPFLVHMKRGVVEEFFVEESEPVVVTNIKKALLSQLQMDLTGSRRNEVVSNHLGKQQQSSQQREQPSGPSNYFSTFESSVVGDCETSYTINPLPNFQAKELEQSMRVSQKELAQQGVISGERSEGEELCRGKRYYQVIKTKSFNNCKSVPVYQSASGIKLKCDFSKAACQDAVTHTSSTRYILCGSEDEFYIREAVTDNNVLTNPLGWLSSKEKMTSKSKVSLTLLRAKSGFSPLPKPSSQKRLASLEFQYPKNNLWSSTSSTKALKPGQETDEYGLNPIMEMPGLRSETPLFPSPLSVSELKQKVAQEMEKVVREIFKSPESCSSRSDIAGSLSSISYYLRPLSYSDLKEIEHSLRTSSLTPAQTEINQQLFYDVLAMTGTNPVVMLIKEKVQNGELSESLATKVLQTTIRNVKTPTQELLRELLELVKSLESKKHIYNIALVQMSNLVNKACINSDSQTSNFPVRIYGLFCKENSEFVTKEYIPYLIQKLQRSTKESEKLVAIAAMGKVGHKDTLMPLVNFIEDENNGISTMGRSVAVYMLKRLSKNDPSLVKPVLMALINNAAESTEVRIAAVSVLPWTKPSTAEWQRITARTWLEPSKQVSSFIYNTLKNIVNSEIPELKSVGEQARGLLKGVKPHQYGIQFSQNAQTKQFIQYLRAASNLETSYVNNENSYTPTKFSVASRLFGSSWEIEGLEFGTYSKGMDSFVDSLWQKYGYKSEVSEQVKEELMKISQRLNIKQRNPQSPSSLIYFGALGYDRLYSLDQEVYNEIISKVSEELRGNQDIFTVGRNFTYTHAKYAIELEAVGPSDSGFPIMTTRNVPFVTGIKGHVQAEGRFGQRSSVKAKIIPVINAKVQSNMGVISPFTKEFLGSGVEVSIHMCTPVNIKTVMTNTGSVEFTLQSPEEIQHQFEVLHTFIKPYTAKKSLNDLQPVSKAQNASPILSAQPQQYAKTVGQSLGLKGILTIDTDYPTPNFGDVWNLVKKHNLVSLVSMGFPSSVKYGSFKLEFNPSESTTKKIEARAGIVYGVKSESSGPVVHYPHSSETSAEKEMEIEQTCQNQHPDSYRKAQLCEEQLRHRLDHNREVSQRINRQLQETSSGSVSGVNLEATLKTESSQRIINTAVLVHGRQEQNRVKADAEILLSTPSSPKYEIKLNGQMQLPSNNFRWSIDSMIDQPISLNNQFSARYGNVGDRKDEIVMAANFFKSDGLKQSLKQSQEMKKCREEMIKGHSLASVCEEVRHQASSVNKLQLHVQYPQRLQNSWIVEKLIYRAASSLLPLVRTDKSSIEKADNREGKLSLTTEVNRAGNVAQATIEGSSYNIRLENISVPKSVKGFFPLSLRNGVSNRLVQDITRNQAPASCRLDNSIKTFDNVTYGYQMNECYHLLYKDCSSFSSQSPVAVLAKRTSANKKVVKILSSRNTIELLPQKPGLIGRAVFVKVDGQEVPVQVGTNYVQRSPKTDQVILRIYRSQDGVVSVQNPMEGFELFYDGKKIEIVAPAMLKNRACGLCGDLNGENTADLKAPEKCIMSSPRLAALSYLMQEGQSCPGIPSEDRQQYEEDKRQCVQKQTIKTRLVNVAKSSLMNRLRQKSLVHSVEVQKNQICVSRSPVKSCSSNTQPAGTQNKVISFTCMVRTSSRAQQILKRIKNGEIIPEAYHMPISFSRSQYVPTSCQSISSWQQQQGMGY